MYYPGFPLQACSLVMSMMTATVISLTALLMMYWGLMFMVSLLLIQVLILLP